MVMKSTTTAILFLASWGNVSAFTTSPSAFKSPVIRTDSFLNMADQSKSYTEDERSYSVPFKKQNKLLDGTFAGDVEFDPLFLAENKELLYNYREAEVKVGRANDFYLSLTILQSFISDASNNEYNNLFFSHISMHALPC